MVLDLLFYLFSIGEVANCRYSEALSVVLKFAGGHFDGKHTAIFSQAKGFVGTFGPGLHSLIRECPPFRYNEICCQLPPEVFAFITKEMTQGFVCINDNAVL